ncbi:uncharacterized protein LOC134646992 [Pelmatolapia mariae]|uniref:uncharacterized protein LOC134646992 n=1 Tax=Pelmatolapia mariae TaxID=158779 RepID=UPI003211CCBA
MTRRSFQVWIFLLCAYQLFSRATAENKDQKVIPAESGGNVTLPCRAPDKDIPIIVVEWSRADLEDDYVLSYRDGQFDPEDQHPSFKNRVDLQDRQMKDGDVSLILKDVTINDTGTYECRVVQRRTSRRKRAHLKTPPISIITLSVVDPPGHTGGQTEDGGKEDEGEKDGGKKDGEEDGSVGLKVEASNVVGMELDSLRLVSERQMLSKIKTMLDNTSHPLHDMLATHRSMVSEKSSTERHRKSFLPVAISLYNSSI